MSVSYPPIDDNIYPESWQNFGDNLEKYISDHIEDLEEESYDVILGFSRGGVILAFAFSCLLKDKIPNIYSKLSKASVRPIPRGLFVKTKDPCFVMNQAATDHEIDDIIINLENDFKIFSMKKNKGAPISVLVMDDNLTGATRVKYIEDILEDMMGSVLRNHKTLAYVRHRAFLETEIPTIIKFPKDESIDVFSMPWHKPSHAKKNLKFDNEIRDLVKIKFCMMSENNVNEFKNKIKKFKYYRIRNDDILVNGASEFIIEDDKTMGIIKLNYMPNKYYPSKRCLSVENPSDNGDDNEDDGNEDMLNEVKFLPLCSLCMGERTKGSCLACSVLNCNKEMFDQALKALGSKEVLVELRFDNANDKLKQAIGTWLIQTFPGIKMII